MREYTNVLQGTPEWLALRKNKIGASDAPVIMGESPWKTPFRLWQEKTGQKEASTVVTPAMQGGHDIEPLARNRFYEMFGITVKPAVVEHDAYPWMLASLDGLSEDKKTMLEIKRPNLNDHDIALNGKIPIKYYPQLQHAMEATGLDQCYYQSCIGENLEDNSLCLLSCVVVLVERNESFIKNMLILEEAFWNCIQEKIAPELEERDYRERADPSWLQAVTEYKFTKSLLRDYEEREKELRKKLIVLADGTNSIGGGVRLSKVMRKGNVDYGAIPELKQVNLEAFRKPEIETWRIAENG